jgi:tetratricopeptide (TPR) repeat protein
MTKLVRTLLQTGEKSDEDEAIKWLEDGYKRFGQYQFRMQIGDIHMRQFNRVRRELQERMEKAETDEARAELADKVKQARTLQVKYELSEYQDRVKAYPTDMKMRFELGKRQFFMQDFDAAIGCFQEAQGDPKYRAMSLRFLGEAFARKEWYDEAIDTYHRAIEVHPYNDDKLAMELRYNLMSVLEFKGREDRELSCAQEAMKIASQIAQIDINYHDIRDRVESLRKLVTELKGGNPSAPQKAEKS